MKYINKSAAVVASVVLTALGGYSGIAFAHTSVDTNGPNSGVSVTENSTNNCSVSNNNNVSSTNNTQQSAQSGNATVGGGSWGTWNPSVWQSNGHSYDDWHSAFTSYMNNDWSNSNSWSGGNTNAGSAVSGDASNENSNHMMLNIMNGSGCGYGGLSNGGGTDVSTEGPHSGVGVVLSSNTTNATENNNHVRLSNNTGQNAGSGSANISGNTYAGGGTSGSSHNGNDSESSVGIHNSPTSPSTGGGSGSGTGSGSTSGGAHISTMGPNSGVSYYSSNNSDTSIVNTNNITTIATVSQTSNTGNANVSGNTSGGSAQTGDALNSNTSMTSVVISN